MGAIGRLIDKMRGEWNRTYTAKTESLHNETGRTLGQELVHEVRIVGNVARNVSSGDLGAVGDLFTANSTATPLDFEVKLNVEKGLKYAVQFLVTIIMSSEIMNQVLISNPSYSTTVVSGVVLVVVSMAVEQIRHLVKIKGPLGISKYL